MSDETPGVVELADDVSALLYGIAGWLAIGFGLLAIVAVSANLAQGGVTMGAALLSAFWLLTAFVLIALGGFVNPRFRRRLNRRHAPSQFGRVRSVDRRVIRSEEDCDERCVTCGSAIEQGLVRRYREEYAIAGVPAYTRSEGYNHYCLECATDELRTADPTDETEPAREEPPTDEELERLAERTGER